MKRKRDPEARQYLKNLGEFIFDERKRQKISRFMLSIEVDVPETTIRECEAGTTNINSWYLYKILKGLGINEINFFVIDNYHREFI